MQAFRSFYRIGVYDPQIYDFWPYGDLCEGMVFLSAKKRLCKEGKAIEFECKTEAREFYASWKHKDKYKMSLRKVGRTVEVADPEYPAGHPNSIMKAIIENEPRVYMSTALAWFNGDDFLLPKNKKTLARHRKVLLKYDIDIYEAPTEELVPYNQNSITEEISDKPKLRVV